MKRPKGLLMDLDNTLYLYEPCHEEALSACARVSKSKLGIPAGRFRKLYEEAQHEVHHRLESLAASHHRLLYFQSLLEKWTGRTDFLWSGRLYDTYWRTFMKSMRLLPGAREFLAAVKSRGIATALVSDLTTHIQFQKISALGIAPYIDFLVTSEEAGREKPHPAIFRLALRKLGLGPREVWMVGDHLEKDIGGANGLRIPSMWISHGAWTADLPPRIRPHHQFGGFEAFTDFLKNCKN